MPPRCELSPPSSLFSSKTVTSLLAFHWNVYFWGRFAGAAANCHLPPRLPLGCVLLGGGRLWSRFLWGRSMSERPTHVALVTAFKAGATMEGMRWRSTKPPWLVEKWVHAMCTQLGCNASAGVTKLPPPRLQIDYRAFVGLFFWGFVARCAVALGWPTLCRLGPVQTLGELWSTFSQRIRNSISQAFGAEEFTCTLQPLALACCYRVLGHDPSRT
ncbi:MAG: hypothetical protein IPK82_26210 [Polyangiaceae bacterium]|nr:hypothetical protein [Polyangiaceae bacterium]